jgi:hypothetical protein
MVFKDVVAVVERTFGKELAVVQDTTVFEVSGEEGGPRVLILLQDEPERNVVLLSADLGEPPPEGRKRLFQTMLEANNLFSGTAGATLALDAATGRARLQAVEAPDALANDVEGWLVPFVETALVWARAIVDFRPVAAAEAEADAAAGAGEGEGNLADGGFGMMPV